MGVKDIGDVQEGQETVATEEKPVKSFSQEEVNAIVARTKAKAMKAYEGLGDLEELKTLKEQAEELKREQALKRGEFDRVLQEKLSAKDKDIQVRDAIIKEYKIDLPIINAAAEFRSINPAQVKALLKDQVKLSEQGEVEVIDHKGMVRYNDKGLPLTVNDLVKSFLDSNPHFVSPTPATTNSKSSFDKKVTEEDVLKMDDKQYAEYRKAQGIR